MWKVYQYSLSFPVEIFNSTVKLDFLFNTGPGPLYYDSVSLVSQRILVTITVSWLFISLSSPLFDLGV